VDLSGRGAVVGSQMGSGGGRADAGMGGWGGWGVVQGGKGKGIPGQKNKTKVRGGGGHATTKPAGTKGQAEEKGKTKGGGREDGALKSGGGVPEPNLGVREGATTAEKREIKLRKEHRTLFHFG